MPTSSTGPALEANIITYRGDTFERWIRIRKNSAEESLVPYTWRMQIRNGSELVKELSTGHGISIASAAGGVLLLEISAIEMAALAPGIFAYDLQCQQINTGKVRTIIKGSFTVTDDITKTI